MALKELPKATTDRVANKIDSKSHSADTLPTARVRSARTKQRNLTVSAFDGSAAALGRVWLTQVHAELLSAGSGFLHRVRFQPFPKRVVQPSLPASP
jgi:hypothetical protein